MHHHRRSLLLLFVFFSWAAGAQTYAQVAPLNDSSGPVDGSELSQPLLSPDQAAKNQPRASILGWSFRSEVDRTDLRHGSEVVLDPGHPEIILLFDAAGAGADKAEFRYRLEDYDSVWTVTQGRLAHYRRLSPGNYKFEVEARAPGQPWVTKPAVLDVQQRPFFYQTWYAYLLISMVLLAITAQLISQRDQLLKGQMGMVLQERNRIASECHDTLMAGFAAISWQLEATARLFRDAGVHAEPAWQSCDLARSMVAHCQAEARRIIWDLRDSDEITNSLSRALAEVTSTYRSRDTPQTTLDIQGDEIPISPGAVHHLACIVQEAVTNAFHHAKPSSIHVQLAFESTSLRLSVRDDGRGFHVSDRSLRAGHFGIAVMEERTRKLGGSLHLISSATHGTELAVTVSFHTIHQPARQQHYIVPWIGV